MLLYFIYVYSEEIYELIDGNVVDINWFCIFIVLLKFGKCCFGNIEGKELKYVVCFLFCGVIVLCFCGVYCWNFY